MDRLIISGNVSYKFVVNDDLIADLDNIFNCHDEQEKITPEFIQRIFETGCETDFEQDVYNELVNHAIEWPCDDEWSCSKIDQTGGFKISKEDYMKLFEHTKHID